MTDQISDGGVEQKFTTSGANSRTSLEDNLRQSIHRFQALVENSNDIVFITTPEGILRYSSPSASKILGHPPSYFFGRRLFDITHPDDISTVAEALAHAQHQTEDPVREIEYRIQHIDGSWRTFAAGITNLLHEPAVGGFLINSHDITARMRTEAALRQSEERFRQVISSISDHIYVTEVSPDGSYTNLYLSPNVEQLTGYPLEEFLADRDYWVRTLIHPADRPGAAAQSERLSRGLDSITEYRLIRADGELIWIRDSGKVYQQGGSRIIYGVVSEITERKRLEEQLAQSQKMEAIGRLAGGVAHDFNNLLTVIIGNAELSLAAVDPEDQLAKDLDQIIRAAQHAALLTRQLLAFSRSQPQDAQVFNLNIVAENLQQVLASLVGEDIELVLKLADDLAPVKADPVQLEQVIINLVDNARDAMPQGGQVAIETANVEFTARMDDGRQPGQYVMLVVADTGIGMDNATRARIFEPFFTTKGVGHGTGLGLASVHGIISQSNGFITVESAPGQGTAFQIYLPRYCPQQAPQESVEFAARASLESINILVVEDEEPVRDLIVRTLHEAGYNVMATDNRDEALHVFQSNSSDIQLLITDIVMPGELQTQHFIERARAMYPDVKVLLISGYSDDIVGVKGGVFSPSNLLKKPFSMSKLLQKVRHQVSGLQPPHQTEPG